MKNHLSLYILFAFACLEASAQNPVALMNGFKNETFLSKNQKDIYTVRLYKGEFMDMTLMQEGVDVIIDAYGPSGKKFQSFDTPNGASGAEIILFIATASGNYRLEVHPFDDHSGLTDAEFDDMMESNQGKYAITSVQMLSAAQYKQKLSSEKALSDKVIHWMSKNAMPVKSVNAGTGFDDLQPLKGILADVKYVGLGEATHGTREFFQMKHRLLEFLVIEMGFTVFAMEASFAGCRNINDYVLYGKGDAHTALASQGFWTWDTEEVIDLIEWMKQYNQTVTGDRKVKFMGFDIQVNGKGGGISKIESYLQKTDTIRYKEMKPMLDIIERSMFSKQGDSLCNEYIKFLSFFVMSRGTFVQKTSEQEYETTLDYIRALGQYIDAYIMVNNDERKQEREWRDYYMASNFMDIVTHEKPGTKIVIWAHNSHVSHNPSRTVNGGLHPFGSYIKDAYQSAYYALGFSFNKGSFQSMGSDSLGKSMGLQEFTLKPAKEQSLDWYFARTNMPVCITNFRDVALPVYMKTFLSEPHLSRSFGAQASRQTMEEAYDLITPTTDFDGMFFINETHRARPTESGMRKAKK